MEQWKDVVGYGGRYHISDRGRVRSLVGKGCILKPSKTMIGPHVVLSYNGEQTDFPVAHLVEVAFGSKKPAGRWYIKHIDGNIYNNVPRNLKWSSYKGEDNTGAKLTEADVLKIRKLADTMTQAAIAKMFNVTTSNISCIIRRVTWAHVRPR